MNVVSCSVMADDTPQRGSLGCARCSTRLMSRSQVCFNMPRRVVIIDVQFAVIVFIALGVSVHPTVLEICR